MKGSLPLLCALVSFAGAFGGYHVAHSGSDRPVEGSTLQPLTKSTERRETGRPQLESLEREVADLRAELMHLRVEDSRQSARVASPEISEVARAATGPLPSSDERSRILTVLTEEQERQAHERELAKFEKLKADLERRAASAVEKLGLPGGSESAIAGVLLAERERLQTLKDSQRGLERSKESKEALQQRFAEVREWRQNELTSLFGVEAGEALSKLGDKSNKKLVNYSDDSSRGKQKGSKRSKNKGDA